MTASPMNAVNSTSSSADDLGPQYMAGLDRPDFPALDFTDFYREIFPVIVTIIMHESNVTGLAEAQDVTQDAFVIALRGWDRIGKMEYPLAYIAKTAVRLARRRSVKAAREIPADSVVGLMTTIPSAEPAGIAAVEDMAAKMIACLPERQAATVRLRMNGATPEEIGKILNVQASTVRSNLRFARASLKALMREQMEDEPEMYPRGA
jgi:RNA polymerase sigma-70 factor, ECF subfamily